MRVTTVVSRTLLINIILSNNESVVSFTDVTPLGLAHHDEIACVWKINHVMCRNHKNYDPQFINLKGLLHFYVMPHPNFAWLFCQTLFQLNH